MRAGWLAGALLLALGSGCVARDAGLAGVQSAAEQRMGKEVRWFHVEGTGAAEERIRELVKRPLDAEAAVQLALLNNPRVQAAFERLGLARGELVGAWKLPNPRVGASAVYFGDGEPELGFDVTISLTRLLLMPGRASAAEAGLTRAQLEVVGQVLDLSFEVRRALVVYQAAHEGRRLLRLRARAADASARAAASLHEAGNLTDLELSSEQVGYQEVRLQLADAELAERTAKLALGELLGLWQLGHEFRVETKLPELPPPSPLEEQPLPALVKGALESSVELATLRERFTEHSKGANSASLAGALPDVSAGVEVERGHSGWGVGPTVHLELPLFDQGQGAASRAESGARQARYDSARVASAVRSRAAQLKQGLEVARRRAEFYQAEVVPLRQRVTEQSLLEYNAMSIGVFELLAARSAELSAAREAARALERYWLVRLGLEQLASGRLGPEVSVGSAVEPARASAAPRH
ncbi:MAG: TolC family protein [Polyangiaceae bacterium]|nr:TolC family protein [Polyangiaceae bacterium]MCW5790997.1 TolC family protein [Polyangiaceae bacterium]